MPSWLIVILCAIGFVGFFVIGMSLTLMIKGHNIDSEISTNKDMQRLGIKCAVHETREADGTSVCSTTHTTSGCHGNCSACDIELDEKKIKAIERARARRAAQAAHSDEDDEE